MLRSGCSFDARRWGASPIRAASKAVGERAVALVLAAGVAVACDDGPAPTTLTRPEPAVTAPADSGARLRPPAAFAHTRELSLLPFDVRLAKVSRVVGVGPTDAVLESLRAARLELGADDYANGIKPDATWTAARLGAWVKALRPVCSSAAMRARYPALPERLGELVLVAYGRRPDDADRRAVEEALGASAADRYTVTCLAILSSVEFVAR